MGYTVDVLVFARNVCQTKEALETVKDPSILSTRKLRLLGR